MHRRALRNRPRPRRRPRPRVAWALQVLAGMFVK
jgi:hypothetical protein